MIFSESIDVAIKEANKWQFNDTNEMISNDQGGSLFEVRCHNSKVKQNQPMQVACSIYQLAKLRMLQYYYGYLQKFFQPMHYELLQMDTDSFYMSLARHNDEDMLKEGMLEEWLAERHLWIPDDSTPERESFNRRVPGLFKDEAEGCELTALCAKSYLLNRVNRDPKSASKGVQKRNTDLLQIDRYNQCLQESIQIAAQNQGFRVYGNTMITYSVSKVGLTPIYDKRLVCMDGVTTLPIISSE